MTRPAAAEAPGILGRIAERRLAAVEAGRLGPAARPLAGPAAAPRSAADNPFLAALAGRRGRAVIAEIKLGSPRLGSLAGRFDPEQRAAAYARGGAAALSVVVEPEFFHGSYELLTRCARASGLPAIAKDFLVDARQIDRAAEAGASAVLLLASLAPAEDLRRLADRARRFGLVPLIELHDAGDAAKLAGAAWELVGVNHRDLRTFAIDLERSRTLRAQLPDGAFLVAESGIGGPGDLERLRALGFGAFLIGEHLLLAPDPETALASLIA